MTHFLRFPDADAWTAAATEAGFITDDTLAAYTHDHAIDVVGEIPELDGWHINFAGELPDGWEQYAVEPANPVRVWL
jgi:hypothetical protein